MYKMFSNALAYNGVSRETPKVDCNDVSAFRYSPSKTVQSARDECDINVIVRRFGVTGQMPGSFRVPSYGDYEGINDFQDAMNVVRQANESFMALPSSLRNRFGNSPQNYLEFVSNPDNLPDMIKLGLASKVDLPDNAPAPVISPAVKEKGNARSSGRRAGKVAEASGQSDSDGDGE